MFRYFIDSLVFLAGLAVVVWVGAGYFVTSPLGLAITLLIGALYVAGALELRRHARATASLAAALDGLSVAPERLEDWLQPVSPMLRDAVRRRVVDARGALPGPVLAQALVGLLVLLGMMGTLLGMIAALRGTGLALETAADLQSVRDALAAPVKGLGFAFGTSIAGVATSAMLGLLLALQRRARASAVHALDAAGAGVLRGFSQARQRDQAFALMQQQAGWMPALVERLQAMAEAIEQRDTQAHARQLAEQQAFHARTEQIHVQLAASVGDALRSSVAAGAQVAGAALKPVVEDTMGEIARQTAALQARVDGAVQQHLQQVSGGLDAATGRIAGLWAEALAGQHDAGQALVTQLRDMLGRSGEAFAQRAQALLDDVSTRLDATAAGFEAGWAQALVRQETAHQSLAERNRDALEAAAEAFERRGNALLERLSGAQQSLQAMLAEQEAQRLSAWDAALTRMSQALRDDWTQAGAQVAERQQAICDALERTAADIGAQSQAHAGQTIAEISRLVDSASEAPRAAAQIVTEMRRHLSESLVRDTAMLDERNQLLSTLDTLLDAVNHASSEQRAAIDALVGTSADLLDRVGTRFTDHVAAETGKLDAAGARVAAGAADVASLGAAFGTAVDTFGAANAQLAERLSRIEDALGKALARSDEQLAYYIAQARELIDLGTLSQKQLIEDLRQASVMRVPAVVDEGDAAVDDAGDCRSDAA